jgi:hypothetical protein
MGTALGNAIYEAKHIINTIRWRIDANLSALIALLFVTVVLIAVGGD